MTDRDLEGHTDTEWYALIGKFCLAFEGCCSALAVFIRWYEEDTGEKDLYNVSEKTAGKLLGRARKLLAKEEARGGETLAYHSSALDQFKLLKDVRNRIIHSPWGFPTDDDQEAPEATHVLKAGVYLLTGGWEVRQLTFVDLQQAIQDAEGLTMPLATLAVMCPNFQQRMKDPG
jgi:hypothetical protein